MNSGRPDPPNARTRTIVAIGAAILGLFLVLLTVGTVPRIWSKRELAVSARDVQNRIPTVYVIRPERAVEGDLSLPATTQAIKDSIIYARTTGYVDKRYVDIGDQVKEGQLLAVIASPEVDQELSQARADLEQSKKNLDLQKANLELSRVTMDRYKWADAEGAVAKSLVDQNVTAYSTAQASVAAAEAVVQSNQANVRRLEELTSFQRVVAPFNGTVVQRNFDVGALITAGSPVDNIAVAPSNVSGAPNGLFELAQTDVLRVFVNVPQPFAPNVRPGLSVQVSVRGQLMQPA